jgi:cobalt-zinc-cadmium efflux system outer membrane protein
MNFTNFKKRINAITSFAIVPLLIALALSAAVKAQNSNEQSVVGKKTKIINQVVSASITKDATEVESPVISPTIALYFDPQQGASSDDLIKLSLTSSRDLAAARLDIDRARARLRQAGLRPNPTIDFEQTTGRLTGSPGERSTSIGAALPLEIGGRRQRRIELAQAELAAAEAEFADRQRRLGGEVLALYTEALAALRELDTTEGLVNLDLQTVKFVQTRVNEGETAPLELNLLQVEVERLRSRRILLEGRLRGSLVRLKTLVGVDMNEPLRLREDLANPISLREPTGSVETAIEVALRTRPDVLLARLNEEAARAGLRLANAQAKPDVTVSARYTQDRSITDLPEPFNPISDSGRTLAFGVSIGIPVFNKNQGAKVEAAVAITQAQTRREFAEQTVRGEVTDAFTRFEAARTAALSFQQGVIARSMENIRVIRASYELGAFTISDLIAEQRRLVDSQRELTELLTERYRALADLQTAIGIPVK